MKSRGTTLVLAMLALLLSLTGRTGHLFRGQLRGSNNHLSQLSPSCVASFDVVLSPSSF
ncbi:MAG: hypothetical protein WC992_03655 [Acholeplasmataceae bacterium]|nr:hypothetical protein [Acholeplasmataceae bacterium]